MDETMQADEDAAWRRDGEKNGWSIARKAAWPLRLWGVRHVRAMWHSYHVERLAAQYASVGIGLGPPNQRDVWVIYAIARGWA